jgi:hypothetical protein
VTFIAVFSIQYAVTRQGGWLASGPGSWHTQYAVDTAVTASFAQPHTAVSATYTSTGQRNIHQPSVHCVCCAGGAGAVGSNGTSYWCRGAARRGGAEVAEQGGHSPAGHRLQCEHCRRPVCSLPTAPPRAGARKASAARKQGCAALPAHPHPSARTRRPRVAAIALLLGVGTKLSEGDEPSALNTNNEPTKTHKTETNKRNPGM